MARKSKQEREDQKILDEMVERFDYGTSEWRSIRKEAAKDMRYVAGDCWEPAERKAREEAMRPVLEVDEVNQYLNQLVNDVRQNKRGIKVSPVGNGANDQSAAFRQGKIRDIEYRSNAQQAYTCLFENAAQRSYGFLRIKAKFCKEDSGFDQELVIEPIVNPDCCTPDPDHQRPDGADMNWLIYHEDWTIKDFERAHPDAKVTDFSHEVRGRAPKWFKGQNKIQLAEYWTKDPAGKRQLLLLKPPPPTRENPQPQPMEVFADELHQMPSSDQILKSRDVDAFSVMQYLTNGVEILERTKWPGQSIPFVTCYGKVLYMTNEGGETEKRILSLIRLARSPQMLYAYYRTQQAEMAGMIPKVPVMGYKGQFRGVEQNWGKANHEPIAFLEAHATTEETGSNILPLPQRLAYEAGAHLQALELCAEGARRAIQSAMGVSPLPTQAQRRNEKSGVALKQMEDSAQKGSFHFIDHYDEAITRTGAILDELIRHYHGAVQETSIRKPDDSVAMVTINDPNKRYSPKLEEAPPNAPPNSNHAPIMTDQGDHDVTLSVGPRESSEREASSDFADSIIQNQEIAQVVGPQKAAELFAAAIRLKGVGPIGDEMADIISPKDQQNDPRAIQQQMGQMKQQLEHVTQAAQQMDQVIKTDQVKAQNAKDLKQMDIDFQREKAQRDSETKIAVAELGAKVDRLSLFIEERMRLGIQANDQAHEAEQANIDRMHAVDTSAQDHQNALQQGQAATGNQAALAEQGQGHALDQQQQAAELAPPPADAGAGA